jgi:hypothetical protein
MCVNKKVQDLRTTLGAVNGLLNWGFLSEPTRAQLEVFKAEMELELELILSQHHQDRAAA